MDVNQTIVKALESINVKYVFGGSGQVNASMLLALRDSKLIKTIIIRNEQAASFMACGYTMFNPNNLGVCFATGGPGAFNLFSGMAVALSDSLPILGITGYTSMGQRGKGALNESTGLSRTPDSQAMFAATCKKSYVLENPDDVCDILEDAINTAFEGRPGPVHIHIPKDVTTMEVTNYRPLRIHVPPVVADAAALQAAAQLLADSIRANRKVLVLIGYGCVRSEAARELLQLIEKYQLPFVQTMDAKGLLPENHPLCLGVFGTSGDKAANTYFQSAEVVLAMGNSFAQNATYGFKPDLYDGKQLIHINIDPHEINKVYAAEVGVVSDIKLALQSLLPLLEVQQLSALRLSALPAGRFIEEPEHTDAQRIFPGDLVRLLSQHLPKDALVMGDAGSHMLWANCYLQLNENQRYQNPGSFGPMACHTNGCMGVQCANPDKVVIACVGDGCYQMAGFELMTAVQYNIPVIWIIFNNSEFNIIKKFLLNMYNDEAYMAFDNPDFVKYAEACGAKGYRVEKLEEFVPALQAALAARQPCLIDVLMDPNAYPPFDLGNV